MTEFASPTPVQGPCHQEDAEPRLSPSRSVPLARQVCTLRHNQRERSAGDAIRTSDLWFKISEAAARESAVTLLGQM